MIRHFLRHLRQLFWTTVLTFALLAALLPPLFGAWVRVEVMSAFSHLNAASLPFRVEVLQARNGWFSSTYQLQVHAYTESIPAQLNILHGPVMWHLQATPLAVAELRLEPDFSAPAETVRHLSASGLVTTHFIHFSLNAIGGFTVLDGEHWLQASLQWPWWRRGFDTHTGNKWPDKVRIDLWIDADAHALANGPMTEHLQAWCAAGYARVSAGRLLGHVIKGDIR